MSARDLPEGVLHEMVPGDLTLLATGYDHLGVLVDLFGTSSKEDGIEVTTVALMGNRISLHEWMSNKQLEDMGYWCERQAERSAGERERMRI